MQAETQAAFQRIVDLIDAETHPNVMSKAEYRNLLEELQSKVDGDLDAVEEEMDNEPDEDFE